MADYGVTWWGNMWLNALRSIRSYSNRIPRGRKYANTNRVYDVIFENNHVRAKVKGNYNAYYNVKLSFTKFSKEERDFIIKYINDSPTILAGLLNGELPIDLYNKLSMSNINIFSRYNDMNTSCNCPDHASLCKHIAAVIYIITREIDRDPFLVFKLRGLDLFKLLNQFNSRSDKNVRKIRTLKSILNNKVREEKITINEHSLNESLFEYDIDFTKIPYLQDSTFCLLKDKTLFYDTNFKVILDNIYHSMSKYSKRELKYSSHDNENADSIKKLLDISKWSKFTINIDENFKINDVITQNNQKRNVLSNVNSRYPENFLYNYINNISNYNLSALSYNIQFWNIIRIYVLELIEHKAVLPEILETDANNYIIRWNPTNYNKEIRKITYNLSKICPPDLIYYNNKSLSRQQQVELAINIMIKGFLKDYIVHGASLKIRKQRGKAVFDLFFVSESIFNKRSTRKDDAYQINQWLSNFLIKNNRYKLYLFIEDFNSTLLIDLQVSFKEGEFESIYKILNDEKYKNDSWRLQLLADSYLIKDLFPDVSEIIDYGKKVKYDISDFYEFFKSSIRLFEIMGIEVILPKQLQEIYRPKIKAEMKKEEGRVTSHLSLEELVNFDWKVAVGDEVYSKKEFEKLLDNSNKLVKIKNKYVYIDEKEAKLILKQLDKLPQKLNNNQLLQAVLTDEIKNMPIDVDYELKEVLKKIRTNKKVKLPKKLHANLRDYQLTGYKWLMQNIKSGFGSILADDMGLGKTLQVLTTILKLKEDNNLDSILIVTPSGLLSNWQNEINKFTPSLTSYIYHGTDRDFPENPHDIILTSYGILRNDLKKLKKHKWFMIVIDEAQNIKNPMAKQTKALKLLKSENKIAITGTPIENRLSEYWSIFDFINKGYLGTQKQFTRNYVIPIEVEKNMHVLDNFKKVTNPFILRRLKTDKNIIKELPDKITNDVYCSLTPKQVALYKETIDSMMDDIENADDSISRKGLIFKLITSLKQICNHPSHYTQSDKIVINDSGKLQVLMDILETILYNNEKVLIFTQYVRMGDILKEVIEDKFNIDVLFLHGKLSRTKKDEYVKEFQNNPLKKVFILSLKAGGTGLNLTKATTVIHYDLWWNPAVEDQATDRAYRIGQNKNVIVYRLIMKDTFEEQINKMLDDKKELTDMALSSNEQFITEMDNNQLKEVFELRK